MRPRPVPGRQVTVSLREALRPDDRGAIEEIVRATGFFSHEEVEIAVELVDDHLEKGLEGGYHFLLAEREGRVVGYACYGQVPATTASWDLYWIATHPDQQGTGLGRVMVDEVADRVRALGGEVLFAETSGRPQYAPTRGFYLRTHFTQAALFPDFYAPGDDRVVYALTL
ncbi:MAG: GNAT family N-acetyltransferase [Deltaproteobacteria bacterium]|nr:GNAT family N-acetyltransferase [Deltaproteobacteria bacterium]